VNPIQNEIPVFLNFESCFETWSDLFFQNKGKNSFKIFKKVTKKSMKKHIFSSNLFKNNFFFNFIKTDDDLNYLAKSVEQNHNSMLQKVQKIFFCDVTKVENYD
jgi:hypothetical protein